MSSKSDIDRSTVLRSISDVDRAPSRRGWLKGLLASVGGISLFSAPGAATHCQDLEITVYQTETLYQESLNATGDGRAALDVATSHLEEALSNYANGVTVTGATARMDYGEAESQEPDRSCGHYLGDLICCGRYAVNGDPREEVSKDANILLKYHKRLSGSGASRPDLSGRGYTWTNGTFVGESTSSHKYLDQEDPNESEDSAFRLWTLIHEGGHALYTPNEVDHDKGSRHYEVYSGIGALVQHDTAFSYRDSQGDAACSWQEPPSDPDTYAIHVPYSNCFMDSVTPRTYTGSNSICQWCRDYRGGHCDGFDDSAIRTCNGDCSHSGGCFITTATVGDGATRDELREFRDGSLMRTPVGRGLVGLYYAISPPIADLFAAHPDALEARLVRRQIYACGDVAQTRNRADSRLQRSTLSTVLTGLYVVGVTSAAIGYVTLRARRGLEDVAARAAAGARDRLRSIRNALT